MMTRALKDLEALIASQSGPLPLKEFTEEMISKHPETPREEVIRRAKAAVEREYEDRRKLFQLDECSLSTNEDDSRS